METVSHADLAATYNAPIKRVSTPQQALCWIIIDRQSGEWVMRCKTRDEARSFCPREGMIAKVIVCR